ncbi:MAG: biotin--[acetyl-CoA-carboxylase] ligase [Gemmatimonadaceae bacterium]|jgi:BirA family biotin operon repressor/biotin-[acetyl-CoA-carboxylase] ligase|nr:biotin--[acetyl-CoA-carboxylase] ligase [Gemmatimonadaceae bacterium]
MTGGTPARAYDGVDAQTLAGRCGAPSVAIHAACASTMDLAHDDAAAGAAHGHVVVADRQGRGRGRAGKAWASAPGAGVWTSIVLRELTPETVAVLSLRIGLALAEALDPLVDGVVSLKWPNDLFVGAGKLAGVLVEVRWRGAVPEWAVAGVGINVQLPPPPLVGAAVRGAVGRPAVLAAVVAATRAAAARRGPLDADECDAWRARDRARGRRCVAPLIGEVDGIDPDGALRVRTDDGTLARATAGSLRFMEE